MTDKKKSFVRGAAILGAAGLVVKILGAVFRIPLGNMVSETAMAYYQPAYYIYSFFVVIATSGIPVAISKMVSERVVLNDYREAHRVFRIALWLMTGIGVVSFAILFFGAGPLAKLMHSPNSKFPMMVIAPSLLFVPWMASYRGYFQGQQNMNPTAVSQIVEQLFRVIVGLTMAYVLYNSGKSVLSWVASSPETATNVKGAMGAISGATVGSLAGLLLILFIYLKSKKAIFHRMRKYPKTVHEPGRDVLKKILIIAVPITVGSCIMPIMNIVEVPIVNSRLLASGFTPDEADVLYGILSGYVTNLVNLPQVLTAALGMSLVPMISSVYVTGDTESLRYNTILGGRLAMLIGLPCAFGMAILAEPIMLLLYPTKPDMASVAAASLAILSIGVIFLSITQTLTAILQGVSRQMIPVRNLAIAILIKIILTYIFVSYPSMNIKGAALASTIAYAVAAVLDIYAVKKYVGVSFPVGLTYVRPTISAGIMAVFALLVYKLINYIGGGSILASGIATMIAIVLAALLYCLLLVVTKSVTREDLANMPKGEKLVRIYDRFAR